MTQITYSTLISTTQLSQALANKAQHIVIIDCRHDLANVDSGFNAYLEGHIPNAIFARCDQDLSGAKVDATGVFCGRHPLPERDAFIATLQSWGINSGTQIVAYDAQGGIFAARLWAMLRWVGHAAVAVLDGGLPAWQAAQLPMSNEISVISTKGNVSAQHSLLNVWTVNDVLANLSASELNKKIIVDARSPDRFRGENETLDPVGGHIPNAKNRFYKDNLRADGTFKEPQQLAQEWQQVINQPQNAVMQCGSGVTACHNLLALEIAQLQGAALYAGSWSEWCADKARPIAVG